MRLARSNLALGALLLGTLLASGVAAAEPASRSIDASVLVVYSYDRELEWTQELHRGLIASFAEAPGTRLHFEYLDAKRWPNLEHLDSFIEHLDDKYSTRQPDVLLLADDPAFEAIHTRRDDLFPGVPIVFLGLNQVRMELTGGVEGVTGVFELHSTAKTVAEAFRLTGAEGIVAINDTSQTGRANEAMLASLRAEFRQRQWRVHRDLVADDLAVLADVPSDWPILVMLPLREGDSSGPMLSQRESVRRLRETLPNPLFYDSGWLMGSGIVGGHLLLGDVHAHRAGDMALEILAGASPRDIPAELSTGQEWVFDARELDRFGWRGDVAPGAVLLFDQPSYWQQHRDAFLATAVITLLATLVITVLALTVAAQRRAEGRLRTQQARLMTVVSASDAGIFEVADGRPRYACPRWRELLGDIDESSRLSDWKGRFADSGALDFQNALEELAFEGLSAEPRRLELRVRSTPDRMLDVLMAVRSGTGPEPTIVGVAHDVSLDRQREQIQSKNQRLSALGELAGGIAHDFNNILTVINVNSEMMAEAEDLEGVRHAALDIQTAGLRAADLVRQLLVFGRAEADPSQRLDLSACVRSLHRFLQRLIGERHELVSLLADEPVGVPMSSAHADQVFSNLILNARDAMPEGGTIEVKTCLEKDADGGVWSVLVVQDGGVGMDAATVDRIFEPFFTTKQVGEGTGLGLSTVYGIVHATGGRIDVDSEPGRGTRFEIRWPRVTLEDAGTDVVGAPEAPSGGSRSILVVEDETSIAGLTGTILEQAGYRVEIASNGQEGLELALGAPNGFDLILTDVVLPKLSGPEMAAAIREARPATRIGYVSGYAQHPAVCSKDLDSRASILSKPFSRAELLGFVSAHVDSEHVDSDHVDSARVDGQSAAELVLDDARS